jgi:hypothetical protein
MFLKICWVITAVAAALATLFFVSGTAEANGAPQEAAAAAMALAIAVIPYVFTRCIEGMVTKR